MKKKLAVILAIIVATSIVFLFLFSLGVFEGKQKELNVDYTQYIFKNNQDYIIEQLTDMDAALDLIPLYTDLDSGNFNIHLKVKSKNTVLGCSGLEASHLYFDKEDILVGCFFKKEYELSDLDKALEDMKVVISTAKEKYQEVDDTNKDLTSMRTTYSETKDVEKYYNTVKNPGRGDVYFIPEIREDFYVKIMLEKANRPPYNDGKIYRLSIQYDCLSNLDRP